MTAISVCPATQCLCHRRTWSKYLIRRGLCLCDLQYFAQYQQLLFKTQFHARKTQFHARGVTSVAQNELGGALPAPRADADGSWTMWPAENPPANAGSFGAR